MPRIPIPKKELILNTLRSIKECGWETKLLTPIEKAPVKVLITKEEESEEIIIYVWNITHGGKTRSKEEYRIQITGIKGLDFEEGSKTLLLGWDNENRVFAAFDAPKHKTFGHSPSLQVTESKLKEALEHGIAFQEKITKKGKDIVVTFAPSFIINYIRDFHPEYHAISRAGVSEAEKQILIKNPLDVKISNQELAKLPSERKKIVTIINRKVREKKFQLYVKKIYSGRCVICGIQANLTDAAHIVAVKDEGTDEITNGILLCGNHHKAYDNGLIAITPGYKIILNEKYAVRLKGIMQDGRLDEFVKESRIGEKIFLPEEQKYYPKKEYLLENCKSKGI